MKIHVADHAHNFQHCFEPEESVKKPLTAVRREPYRKPTHVTFDFLMARFDAYSNAHEPSYLLDVQADLLVMLNTGVLVPLQPIDQAPRPAERLNPVFDILGQPFVMVTQFMAAVPRSELKTPLLSLDKERFIIPAAIDFLHQGS